jgi:hypothetical protein
VVRRSAVESQIGYVSVSMRVIRTPVVLAVALALADCLVRPDYQRPVVGVPAHFKELDGWMGAQPAEAALPRGN